MASIIRIKRSPTAGNPTTLGAGELAYSALTDNGSNGGDRLYIGMGTETAGDAANHYVIGGKFFTDRLDHTAGTLTASSAIVVDANSKIDVLNVDNLTLNGNTLSSTDTNGNILITPNGTGKTVVSNLYINDTSTSIAEYIYDTVGGAVTAGTGISVTNDDAGNSSTISLTNTGVTAGSYGSSSAIPTFTVDAQGRLTVAGEAAITTSSTLDMAGDSGTDTVDLASDTLSVVGDGVITTAVTNNTITISAAPASTMSNGVASFDVSYFTVDPTGWVSLDTSLSALTLTVGTTDLTWGGSFSATTQIDGLQTLNMDTSSGSISSPTIEATSYLNGYNLNVGDTVPTPAGHLTGIFYDAGLSEGYFAGSWMFSDSTNISATGNEYLKINWLNSTNIEAKTAAFTIDGLGALGSRSTFAVNVTDLSVDASGNTSVGGDFDVTGAATFSGGINAGSNAITGVATPVNNTDAANKEYVDTVAQGLHVHAQVHALADTPLATITGNTVTYSNGSSGIGATLTLATALNLAGGDIDGDTDLAVGDRIIINGESTAAHNGIYVITSTTVLTRADDFNTAVEMAGGDFVFVTHGSTYADTGWVLSEAVTTVGTTGVTFVQFSGAGAYTAGAGLTQTGTTFDVVGTANRITVNANDIDIASTYVGQTSITTLGTISTGVWNGTTIATGYGGTGLTSYTTGDLIYASSTNTLAKRAAGTDGQVLQMNASGVPVWGDMDGGTY